MKWYNNTGDDSGVGSGVLLPEFQTPATTPATVTPAATSPSGISADALTQLLTTGLQIGGSISQQRRASGASANRQARLAACGRRPLFGRARKDAYERCLAGSQGGINSYFPPSQQPRQSNTLLFVGLGVALLGVVGYVIYRRNK
jgi:LPXTG-motif cell wall-anchored protein